MYYCMRKYIVCTAQKSTPYWPAEEHPIQRHGILTVELLMKKPSDIPDVMEYDITVCITTDVRVALVQAYFATCTLYIKLHVG